MCPRRRRNRERRGARMAAKLAGLGKDSSGEWRAARFICGECMHFPRARKIVLIQDNLNTHARASFYEAFPPVEARRLAQRFDRHYTPKHGNWLNMAEPEL